MLHGSVKHISYVRIPSENIQQFFFGESNRHSHLKIFLVNERHPVKIFNNFHKLQGTRTQLILN